MRVTMKKSSLGFGKLFNVLQSPIGRMASRPMRNIETFPSKQMYPYLSLVKRKVAEFYLNIDRKRWLVLVEMTYFHPFFRTIHGVHWLKSSDYALLYLRPLVLLAGKYNWGTKKRRARSNNLQRGERDQMQKFWFYGNWWTRWYLEYQYIEITSLWTQYMYIRKKGAWVVPLITIIDAESMNSRWQVKLL